jgi:uncharacterized protein YbbC (DUF1343 family)
MLLTIRLVRPALFAGILLTAPSVATAQAGGPIQEASRLDAEGSTKAARAIIQTVIDSATAPAAKAAAQRAMAMSYAFDGDCANTVKYEEMVIAYWKTREEAEPQNAFYQEGEMANEAARVCIDAGKIDVAEKYYRMGSELGLKEPEPKTHPKSLWDYRLAHALGRIAARRGNSAEAKRQMAEARRILDSNPKMAEGQERFYPYLAGYVALYTGDLKGAETELTKALSIRGNQNDPFMNTLLGMTYEKLNQKDKAKILYQKAYDVATAHNPPAAFVRPFVRTKLPAVIPGIEVLLKDSLHVIRGKRIGLLTNHSGRDRNGTSTIDLLFKAPGVKLVKLYAAEHGIRGTEKAGAAIGQTVDSATGLPVYSLYGKQEMSVPQMLEGIDMLLYDIQDVGARVYTYQWTMANTAAVAKIPVLVLDRPDPIRADRYEGNILDPKFSSLVGQYPVALRYGLTPGELLRFLAGTKLISADVRVIPMKGYTRSMWFNETMIPRVNPSPNLRNLDAETLYPGTVFFEGTTATEGRGTDDPFTLIGASWLTDNSAIAAELNAMKLPGVQFDTATKAVETGYKFGGQTIPMIKVRVTDRNQVRAVETGIRMLRAIYAHHPQDFQWRTPQIDRLAGTDKLRAAVEQNSVDALIKEWNADAEQFAGRVKPYLLYK